MFFDGIGTSLRTHSPRLLPRVFLTRFPAGSATQQINPEAALPEFRLDGRNRGLPQNGAATLYTKLNPRGSKQQAKAPTPWRSGSALPTQIRPLDSRGVLQCLRPECGRLANSWKARCGVSWVSRLKEAGQFNNGRLQEEGLRMRITRGAMLRVCMLACMIGGVVTWGMSQSAENELEQGFKNPPDSAKPRAWWHWLNGNITKEGITADLEWMKRVGIAGMQMFDGNLATPVFVDKRLVWMTPEWKEAFHHAGAEAARLGLEMAMAASGGWSETAGPWVKPEEAMKKVVWSETLVEGPRNFSGVLAHPPTNNGKFQNMGMPPEFNLPTPTDLPGAKPQPPAPPPRPDPTFYADSKVIAYRLPEGEVRMADLHPKVTTNAPDVDTSLLTDGDVSKPVALQLRDGESEVWVQFEFPQPYKASA